MKVILAAVQLARNTSARLPSIATSEFWNQRTEETDGTWTTQDPFSPLPDTADWYHAKEAAQPRPLPRHRSHPAKHPWSHQTCYCYSPLLVEAACARAKTAALEPSQT